MDNHNVQITRASLMFLSYLHLTNICLAILYNTNKLYKILV